MKEVLEHLRAEICNLPEIPKISKEQYENFANNCVVALMTGGESSRFKEVEGANGTNKNSFRLPNNDTMIEMTIRMYRDAGIKDFVALVYHEAHTVKKLLGEGEKLGVTVFSPKSFKYFDKLFYLDKKSDFEKVLFPILSKKRELYAVAIPNECWLAVNNLKVYKQLVAYLEQPSNV